MTKIWRVQNKDGHGPYQSGFGFLSAVFKAEIRIDLDFRHPTPADDGLYPPGREWKFGFPTEEAAHNWFSKEDLDKLSTVGYHLVTLEVEKCETSPSGKQCIWK